MKFVRSVKNLKWRKYSGGTGYVQIEYMQAVGNLSQPQMTFAIRYK